MRRAHFLAPLALSVFILLAGGGFAGASPLPVFSNPVALNPGNVQPSHDFDLVDVSCVAPGSCTAVGTTYNASFNVSTPVAITETKGVWGKAQPVSTPAGALSHSVESNVLNAVQCPSIGNCVAVGEYVDASGIGTPMAASEVNGVWQAAVPITLPADAISATANATREYPAYLSGLSCQSLDTFTAIGTYYEAANGSGLMSVSDSGGTWEAATEIGVSAGYQMEADSWSISCSDTVDCTAAGPLLGTSAYFASTATESDGTWGDASAISTTRGSDIDAISCRSTTTCVAVGYKGGGSHAVPLIFDEGNGVWGQIGVSVPSPGGYTNLLSVSCVSVGNCDVVGDATSEGSPFVVVDSHGKWLKPIILPAISVIDAKVTGGGSVSCVSSAFCTVVGWHYLSGKAVGAVAWTSR
jgi:hypothetical protein